MPKEQRTGQIFSIALTLKPGCTTDSNPGFSFLEQNLKRFVGTLVIFPKKAPPRVCTPQVQQIDSNRFTAFFDNQCRLLRVKEIAGVY